MKKICLCIIITLFSLVTRADENGVCGPRAYWKYEIAKRTLTISGVGTMHGYEPVHSDPYVCTAPWRKYAKYIETVIIEDGVQIIGKNAFRGCTSLNTVIIGKGVSSIREYAFYGCFSLTSLDIPSNVSDIGPGVFYFCTGLTSVISEMENPCSIYENCFSKDVYNNTPLYVPRGTIEKYKSTDYWNKFLHIIEGNPFEHTLTYLVDGETYSTYTLEEGNTITPDEAPTKEGYTFSGWSEIPETMPANDVTITGTFVPNKYKLTYFVDGGEYKISEIEFGAAITAEESPTKEGYTFSGWSEIPETMPASDVTITGSFTINKYKLTYTLDGEEYKTAEVDYGTALTPEEAPVKEGYTFSGWSEIPTTMPASDVTITGTFVPNKYKLSYVVDGVEYKSSEVEFGSAITAEEKPTKEGYTFSGWSEIPETMPASDVTISGSFTINKYKLTYTLDGKEYKTAEVDYGTALTPEEAPVKEGYTFSGWSEIPETMPANDVTVTGTFTANKYKLTYMVDGEEYKASEVDYGTAITAEAVPTKEGYTFSGWSEIPTTMPAEDVTVTGTFTVNKYKLTYMVDGVEYKSYEVEYGASITPEAFPANEGQTFSGWSEIPTTMPANDVVITGTFSDNSYELTYMVDGEVFKSSHVEYGSTITPETPPTKEGYTFSGWSEIPTAMPASDVTIYGTFTINKYKLTYTVDGKVFKSSEVEFGSAITAEDNPTKEGYTFSGWSDIPETMPAGDVTIIGSFTINKYKLTYMVDGVEYKSYEVEFGASITPEASPANEGQTFSGWSEIPTTMPAQDVVITGTFSDNSYKLTYMVDGEVFKSSHVEYGSTITPETPPTKEGYTFSGWSEIPTTMPASDVTISGTFTPNKYKLTYTVDGVEYKTAEVDCGASITPEDNPTKEGYTFSGWSEIPKTMPASDVTVSGTFTINTYMITYMVDNALLTTEEVTYGSTITPPASPKEGYEITWNSHPTTMPAYDVTIYGSYISTGINGIYAEESDKKVYTPDGKRIQSPKKGMNIIRKSDGKIKKVVVK